MGNPMPKGTQRYCEKNLIRVVLVISVFLGSIIMVQGNTVECGTVELVRPLVIGGNAVLRDEWPFIAALYYSRSFKYFCGGTIISNKHVLTAGFIKCRFSAAHCVHGKFSNVILSPDEITVRLGAYNLTASRESGAFDRNVTQIHMHPGWNILENGYDADIAVLVLNENITFSINIRPICMPTDDFNIEGLKGMVVGWGITDNGTAEGIPRQLEITALSHLNCYRQDGVIARYSSERSFCGIGEGSLNNGDSGDGFFVVTGSAWVQYGTVSIVRTSKTGHVADVFAALTKLTSLKHWIADTVRQSGSSISEPTMKINLHCTYAYDDDGIYGCWPLDLNIRKANFVMNSVTGSHKLQKENKHVELIVFESGVMFFLPDNIGNFFKNLKRLTVAKSIGTKRIFRSNFQSLEHLEDIRFFNNDIEGVDEDSLWDLSELQSFRLDKSKLRSLNATTFSRNSKLTKVYVLSSVLRTLPRNLFENNLLLESVAFDSNFMETLNDGTFDKNANLKIVSFKRNRLEYLNNNLFRNNFELEIVDFSYNLIKAIGEQIFQTNSKLKMLSLESNYLEYLPPEILQDKPFLERIDFSKNSLKSIDERLFETNANVSEIHLRSNQLDTLPSNLLQKNVFLEIVDLGENFIETIDAKLFETNVLLQAVSLKSNRLTHLPEHLFRNNFDLEFVNFRSNFLETINEHTFERNEKLVGVCFASNYIKFLPPKLFTNNLLLQTVDFANNYLVSIDEQIFEMNLNLRKVYLSSNLLVFLPTKFFQNNLLLKVVDLSKNSFEAIDENIFITNLNLIEISLKENRLQTLPRRLFESNTNLEHIDLNNNQLKIIEMVFTEFISAVYIHLFDNVCIDAGFYKVDGSDSGRFQKVFRNLAEFQNLIDTTCTHRSTSTY